MVVQVLFYMIEKVKIKKNYIIYNINYSYLLFSLGITITKGKGLNNTDLIFYFIDYMVKDTNEILSYLNGNNLITVYNYIY